MVWGQGGAPMAGGSRSSGVRCRLTLTVVTLGMIGSFGSAQEPSSAPQPEDEPTGRLDIHFAHRTRFETLSNRFRIGEEGGDQQLPMRTRVRFDVGHLPVPFELTIELQDSRVHLDDEGSLVTGAHLNEADLLQANVSYVSDEFFGLDLPTRVRGGRFTVDLGSRRLMARNDFRNTTNAFDGVHGTLDGLAGFTVQSFVTAPVAIEPEELDSSDSSRWFWGVFAGRAWPSGLRLDVFYLGFDSDEGAAVERSLTTSGVRFRRAPSEARLDFEVEGAWQTGEVDGSQRNAFFTHLELGYRFSSRWRPRLILQYDFASGDDDPADGLRNDFSTLFGARRFDFGPTGIYGPFRRSNISTPGVRTFLSPTQRLALMAAHRYFWLAEGKDAWKGTGLRDPSGASGDFLGWQLEVRLRWQWIDPLRIEAGWSYFSKGSFISSVPGSPGDRSSNYFYLAAQVGVQIQ